MSQDNAVRDALKALSDVLNSSGQDVNVSISKLGLPRRQDQGPRFKYIVSAEVVEHIKL